jgi:epoxyqueuosine reductase
MPQSFLRHFWYNFIMNKIKNIFFHEKIEYIGVIPASEMTVINARLMPDADIKSCIAFLVPYKTDDTIRDNCGISVYARSLDYHTFFSELYSRIIPQLSMLFPEEIFFGFADHSPVNEKLAAAKAGLGCIGRNSLLINEKYGSFVFIGSILTTLSLPADIHDIEACDNCGLCVSCCPVHAIGERGIIPEKCLSYISQKKNKNENELHLLRKNNTVWGCDICQNRCPMNSKKKMSDIDYFKKNKLDNVTEELISSMPDEVFRKYAFAWRGKNTILQNLRNIHIY